MANCSRCGQEIASAEPQVCASCQANVEVRPKNLSEPALPPEFDHRGIRLPARTRIGGIIIPQ
jgi:hypothetical protein